MRSPALLHTHGANNFLFWASRAVRHRCARRAACCVDREMVDTAKTKQYAEDKWDHSIIPTLQEYIRIPNQSPSFDPTNAHLDDAVNLLFAWVEKQQVPGAKAQVSILA